MAVTIVLNRWNLANIERNCESMGLEVGKDFDFVWTEGIDSGWTMVFYDDADAVMWQLKYGGTFY